jgi:hypothetical protein
MRRKLFSLVVVLIFAAVTSIATANVVISEVMSDSSHDNGSTNDNGDWFEITNTGTTAVSLYNWEWVDDDSEHDNIAFPDITIAAGESIICLEEGDADDWLSSWGLTGSGITVVTEDDFGDFHGLSKKGDSILLYDNLGALVDSFTWTSSSEGFSTDVLAGGVYSQVGVNGAWASNDIDGYNDVASPGVIPEPATIALLGLGGLILRRRK